MRNNSAARIYRIVERWRSISPESAAMNGWMRVFHLESHSRPRDFSAINIRLQVLQDELDVLKGKLIARGASAAIYQPVLDKLGNALSPELVLHQAQHVRQHITEDVYTGLAFCTELLPIEEAEISEQDFREFVDLVNQLELALQENDFPGELVALIRRHVRLAEIAIAQYPLRGAAALQDAVKAAVGDLIFESDATMQADEEGSKLVGKVWRKASDIVDVILKVDGLAQLGVRGIKFLERM